MSFYNSLIFFFLDGFCYYFVTILLLILFADSKNMLIFAPGNKIKTIWHDPKKDNENPLL